MRETTLLIAASISMLVISLLAAGALYLFNASSLWVVLVGTLAGIAVYVGFFAYGSKLTRKEPILEEEESG